MAWHEGVLCASVVLQNVGLPVSYGGCPRTRVVIVFVYYEFYFKVLDVALEPRFGVSCCAFQFRNKNVRGMRTGNGGLLTWNKESY